MQKSSIIDWSKRTYDIWTAARPEAIVVQTGTSLLGAKVIEAIQSRRMCL